MISLMFYEVPGYNHPVMGKQIATLREDLATRVALTDKWASGVTSKPANGGHSKTGQRKVAWD